MSNQKAPADGAGAASWMQELAWGFPSRKRILTQAACPLRPAKRDTSPEFGMICLYITKILLPNFGETGVGVVQCEKLSPDMEVDVKELEERILRDGKDLGGGILKVDGFVNHQVDPLLMDVCGREFARRFASVHATKVLTAEISGIAPAVTTA